jgi:hypothetical protein
VPRGAGISFDAAFGAASPVTPKFIARSDPAAQWTGAHKGHAFFAYATNYLIDTDHGVIVDVEATRAIRQAEVGASRTMVERTEERFGLKPGYLVADTAYGSAENLAWLVKRKRITPYTRPGVTFPSRVAGSLLHALGLSELAVEDQDDYFKLAYALAMDAARLGNLRRTLACNRLSAPLFDVKAYTLALESLYTRMRERYRLGLPPAAV